MPFRKLSQIPPSSRQGIATIVWVGASQHLWREHAVAVKLRLRVELPGLEAYECTAPWEVQLSARRRLQVGRLVPVAVDPTALEHVHPQVPWAHFSVLYSWAWSARPRPTAEPELVGGE